MSIDNNVGALNHYLTHLTTSPTYNTLRYKAYKLLKKLHIASESRRAPCCGSTTALKSLLTRQQNIFEGLNIRYLGPFDGHDVEGCIVRAHRHTRHERPAPAAPAHHKGKGYAPAAEADPASWHAPGKIRPGHRPKGAQVPKARRSSTRTCSATPCLNLPEPTASMRSHHGSHEFRNIRWPPWQAQIPERVFDVGISKATP